MTEPRRSVPAGVDPEFLEEVYGPLGAQSGPDEIDPAFLAEVYDGGPFAGVESPPQPQVAPVAPKGPGMLENFGRDLAGGTLRTGANLLSGVSEASRFLGNPGALVATPEQRDAGPNLLRSLAEKVDPPREHAGMAGETVEAVTEGIPQLAAQVFLYTTGGKIPAAAGIFAQSFGAEYKNAKEQRASEGEALASATGSGLSEALVSLLPLGKITEGASGGLKKRLAKIATSFLFEGGQEFWQEFIDRGLQVLTYADEPYFNEGFFERAMVSGLAGGILGAGADISLQLGTRKKAAELVDAVEEHPGLPPPIRDSMSREALLAVPEGQTMLDALRQRQRQIKSLENNLSMNLPSSIARPAQDLVAALKEEVSILRRGAELETQIEQFGPQLPASVLERMQQGAATERQNLDGSPEIVSPEDTGGGELELAPAEAPPARSSPSGAQLGIAVPNPVEDAVANLVKKLPSVGRKLYRGVKTGGVLDTEVVEAYRDVTGEDAATNREVEMMVGDFHQAFRALPASTDYDAMAKTMNTALFEEDLNTRVSALEALPESVQEVATRWRNRIDEDSVRARLEMTEEGSPLAEAMQSREGFYGHRTYRAHTDPEYTFDVAQQENPEAYAAVFEEYKRGLVETELRKGNEGVEITDAMVEAEIYELFDNAINFEGMRAPTQKDADLFKKRRNLSKEMRQLLGEQTDPIQNLARTILPLSRMIARYDFHKTVRDLGIEGGWLHERRTEPGQKSLVPESDRLSPLAGYFADPELAADFRSMTEPDQIIQSKLIRGLLRFQSLAKQQTVVNNPAAQMRNGWGAGLMVLGSGNVGARYGDALRLFRTEFQEAPPQQQREEILKLRRYGVTGSSTRALDLKGLSRDALGRSMAELELPTMDSIIVKGVNQLTAGEGSLAATNYGALDDFSKMVHYYGELKALRDIYGDTRPAEELEREAARITRNLVPTYSSIARPLQRLFRRAPFGNFPAFPLEILRTRVNVIGQGANEVKAGKKMIANGNAEAGRKMRNRGIKRITTAAAMTFWATWADMISRSINDISDEEAEDASRFLPIYSKYSKKFWLPKGEFPVAYIDLSWTDPFSIINLPVSVFIKEALGKEGDVAEGSLKAFATGTESFFDVKFIAKSLLEAGRGQEWEGDPITAALTKEKIRSGRSIWEETDTIPEIGAKMSRHMLKDVIPGWLRSLDRIFKGMSEETNGYYVPDPKIEVANMLTGVRRSKIDDTSSAPYKAIEHRNRINAARKKVRDSLRQYPQGLAGLLDDREEGMRRDIKQGTVALLEAQREAYRDYRALIRRGKTRTQAIEALRYMPVREGERGGTGLTRVEDIANRRLTMYWPQGAVAKKWWAFGRTVMDEVREELADEYAKEDLRIEFPPSPK